MKFNFQLPSTFVLFFFFAKIVSVKVVHPLKIYQHAQFHAPTLRGSSFASISEVSTTATLE
jgi:hypothetical protein